MNFFSKNESAKYFLAILLFAVILALPFVSNANTISFENNLNTQFSGYAENEVFLHWEYMGNNFEGMLFPTNVANISETEVVMNITLYCDQQLQGLYYNNQRWLRIRPLDQTSLEKLKLIDSSYNNLSLTWWLFLSCSGQNANEVYGQISSSVDGEDYKIIAWVDMDLINNSYNNLFAASLLLVDNKLTGHLFDNRWGVASAYSAVEIDLTGTIVPVTWTHLIYYNWNYFSDQQSVIVKLTTSKPAYYEVIGDLIGWMYGNIVDTISLWLSLSAGDGNKTIHAGFSNISKGEYDSDSAIITLDTWAPSAPNFISPLSWSTHNVDLVLSWDTSVDSWAGIDHYSYSIDALSGGSVISNSTSATSVNIGAGILTTGSYIAHVTAYDRLWNFSNTDSVAFEMTNIWDTTPDTFSFSRIRDARLSKSYDSNTIEIQWLDDGVEVFASLSRWVLFIDEIFAWTGGYVSNGSGVWIELISSDHYNTTRSSTLEIWWETASFRITTYDEDDDDDNENHADWNFLEAIEKSQRVEVIGIFNMFKELYGDNELWEQFFYAFKEMLEDKIDILEYQIDRENDDEDKYQLERKLWLMEYFYDLVSDHLMDEFDYTDDSIHWLDGSIYTAPNGNRYTVVYNSIRQAFTAEEMLIAKYFPTVDGLTYYLAKNNPAGWTTYADSVIVTPNGKTYRVRMTDDGRFTSPDMVNQVYFETRTELRRFLDYNNPVPGGWDHRIDPSFDRVNYTTASWKIYGIFKTMNWRYSAYQFVEAKYFPSMEQLVDHLKAWN